MFDLIFIIGAPASGKSELAALLKKKIGFPNIDFNAIRCFYLNEGWTNGSEKEQRWHFEAFIDLLHIYIKNDVRPIVVHDVPFISELLKEFPNTKVITLMPTDDEIRKRIGERKGGFRDPEAAVQRNKYFREISFPNETKIDNTQLTSEQTFQRVFDELPK